SLSEILDQRRKYQAGRPLFHRHRLADLPWPHYIDGVARVMARVAWALHAAHASGIVHCDVKPANILLDREDERLAYLIDFGLGGELERVPLRASRGGGGTVLYMAPEKLSGRRTDEVLCDVYSLGATALEALALRPPRVVPDDLPQSHWAAYLRQEEPPR